MLSNIDSGSGSGISRQAFLILVPTSSASALTSAKKLSCAMPDRIRYCLTRSIGSFSFHDSSSADSRYLVGSSVVVCAPIR